MTRTHPENILVLTATITPPSGVPSLRRLDPVERRADYHRAFAYNLALVGGAIDRLVFVENSNAVLDDFAAAAQEFGVGDRVEFLAFNGLDYPPSHGRAYGEWRLLEHAVDHSETLRSAAEDAVVWKLTGRYRVSNLASIIETKPRDVDLYFNLRNYPGLWADMYLLSWTKAGFEGLLRGIADHLREDVAGGAPERKFRMMIDEARREGRLRIAPRFRRVPILDGVRGYDNRHYTQGEGRLKLAARRAASQLAPWLWI